MTPSGSKPLTPWAPLLEELRELRALCSRQSELLAKLERRIDGIDGHVMRVETKLISTRNELLERVGVVRMAQKSGGQY